MFLAGWTAAMFCHQPSAAADEFPQPYDSEKDLSAKRLDPAAAAAAFRVPDGFAVNVFAAEPDVANPIAVTWDMRGRLWVAENYTYAERPTKFDLNLRDRVLIFSDEDGDGRFDKRCVFLDDVRRLTSIEVGLGGVWLMCPPQVLFVPDRDGDDRPDGPAEPVLEGFDVPPENYHNFANGLALGARRLVVRPLRRLGARRNPPGRLRPTPFACRCAAASGATIPRENSSRPFATARPILGATIGTSTARRSSLTPSTGISGT